VFFSFGGTGMLIWLLFGLAYTRAEQSIGRAAVAEVTLAAHNPRTPPGR